MMNYIIVLNYLQLTHDLIMIASYSFMLTVLAYTFDFFPDLSYNIALCFYSLKQYAPALKHIADIIERGIREHPGWRQ